VKRLITDTIARLAQRAGYSIIKADRLGALQADTWGAQVLRELQALPGDHGARALALVSRVKSQYGQDLAALAASGFKRDGFFVEFGATDGLCLSNTWLLEKEFGWTGILAEPARRWHQGLAENRNCTIERRCVWHRSGEKLRFRETPYGELSTVASFAEGDQHAVARKDGVEYEVETISLNDLLTAAKAPPLVDFLSMDTEGTEYLILEGFDFSRHQFRLISVEHNHGPQRHDIHKLLSAKGYVRILEGLSPCDDWYVVPGLSQIETA